MILWIAVQLFVLLSTAGTFVWAFTRPMDGGRPGEAERADIVKEKLFTALGALLILGSFLYLPWLRFNIFGHFGDLVETLVDLMPAFLSGVLARWGPDGIVTAGELLGQLLDLLQMKGWLLWLATPDPRAWAIILRILALLSPALLALLILLWSPIVILVAISTRSLWLNRGISWFEATVGFLALFLLVAYTPEIDAWGTTGHPVPGLAAAFLGTEVGWGIYVALVGLALVIFGGYAQYRQRWASSSQVRPQTRPGRTQMGGRRW